jgi:hypothetical protein
MSQAGQAVVVYARWAMHVFVDETKARDYLVVALTSTPPFRAEWKSTIMPAFVLIGVRIPAY